MGDYRDLFNASIKDPAEFWAQAARAVSWIREPRRVLDDSNPPFFRWFPDGELNTCANALDRHVADGHAEQAALTSIFRAAGSVRTEPVLAGLWG
jgi:propionyl-CoA synthetase